MHLIRGLIIGLVMSMFLSANAVQKGGIQYNIPIDYSFFNEQKLSKDAETTFNRYLQSDNEKQQALLLDQLLYDYSILGKLNPENPLYFTRLGIIYDKLGKDRWAKSNFFRGSNITNEDPYAFYSFGNFYFDRKELLKALKEYQKAYNCGYSSHYDTLYKMGLIYEKLGDFKSAIYYYKKASAIKGSDAVSSKIIFLESLLNTNSLYDKKPRRGTY